MKQHRNPIKALPCHWLAIHLKISFCIHCCESTLRKHSFLPAPAAPIPVVLLGCALPWMPPEKSAHAVPPVVVVLVLVHVVVVDDVGNDDGDDAFDKEGRER